MERTTLYFYTKSNCPLCDEAREVLEELKLAERYTIVEKDIESDDQLLEQYGLMIPVLELNGEIIQYGRFVKKDLNFRLNHVKFTESC